MGRTDSCPSSRRSGLHHDHPLAYWQRLNSYQNSRPSSYTEFEKPKRPSAYAKSDSDSRPSSYTRSYTESTTESYEDSPTRPSPSRPTSYADSPTRPSPTRLTAHADSPPRKSRRSRPSSYADSRGSSYLSDAHSLYGKRPPPLRKEYLTQFDEPKRRSCWSRNKRKIIIIFAVLSVILLAIIIGVAVKLSQKSSYNYTPSSAYVTNVTAFQDGGATRANPNVTSDGIGNGQDTYIYYSGPVSNFPPSSRWISFDSMWTANQQTLQKSCGWLKAGPDNTPQVIQDIYNAVQSRASVSLVDHRFIFAVILQESNGCPRVGATTSSGGVNNPGLMQSHNGHSYSPSHSSESIMAMVQDGTQGTQHGDGLVQNLDRYGDPYSAARGYNSGHIAASGNLSEAAGATACYVTDIANRLTGWVFAETKCHE